MCVDEVEWAGSPQKGRRKKLQKIAEHLNALADAGARAAKIPLGVDVRYKETRSQVQRGLDFSTVTSEAEAASATKTAQKKWMVEECMERKKRKPICLTAVWSHPENCSWMMILWIYPLTVKSTLLARRLISCRKTSEITLESAILL